jgi:hypothetical protein
MVAHTALTTDTDGCCVCDHCLPHKTRILDAVDSIDKQVKSARHDHDANSLTPFDSQTDPQIPMLTYVRRFVHYHAHFEWPVIPVVLIYISRIQTQSRSHALTRYNVHRIVCTAFVIAYKYTSDFVHSNATMAKVAGLNSVRELNALENYFVKSVDWNLHVTPVEFDEFARTSCVA